MMEPAQVGDLRQKAKAYSKIKYGAGIIGSAYSFILLLAFQGSGASIRLSDWLYGKLGSFYQVIPAYLVIVSICYYILEFPLNFYGSFLLERKFNLSEQRFLPWFIDTIKSLAIFYIIGLVLLCGFYYILAHNSRLWWCVVSLFWIFFSLVLAKLAPVVIVPIFFKYKPVSDEGLKSAILRLAEKMNVLVMDVFEIDLSKKSLKANAAFTGLGRTKRVILSDTLKNNYTNSEIEVILAHEFAHYRLKHIWRLLLFNSLTMVLSFYLLSRLSGPLMNYFHARSLSDIGSLPVLLMYFMLINLILQPVHNYYSRQLEKRADIAALKVTGLKDEFISMMNKLSRQNLADCCPHPVIKFLFFDHPSINERIGMAKGGKYGSV